MDWTKILADEDRIIHNADRCFRRHSYSLESMSEELVHMECRLLSRCDPLDAVCITDFVDTVESERLADALRSLTARQQRMIELAFWEGYKLKEIAVIMDCKPNTVSQIIASAKRNIYLALTK